MKKEIKAPSVGESITEVSILKWTKQNGQAVKSGEVLLEIESDKASVEVIAENSGVLQITKQAGERVLIGAVLGFVDDSLTATTAASVSGSATSSNHNSTTVTTPTPSFVGAAVGASAPAANMSTTPGLSPSVRRAAAQHGVNTTGMSGSGKDGRLTKSDVMTASQNPAVNAQQTHAAPVMVQASNPVPKAPAYVDKAGDRRVPMSMLRQKIAERLVHAQHTAAILTTFNEVDMSAVNKIRAEFKEKFKEKYGVNLSFMSFFTKASVIALKAIPEVNATIDGKDIVYHDYIDIGVAVGTERGLVVPVIRDADKMDFVDIEKKIGEFAIKGRDGKLTMADLSGGTFTISNGGTYGSLMSTPILNPPQSGILGMHKIMDRPVVVAGKIEIRPMMYLALSYDHRIIDGKGAVTFLVTLKDLLENPEKLGFKL